MVLSLVIYMRGCWLLQRAGLAFVPRWRAVAFLSGLGSLWIALASPLDVFNGFLLTAHMLEHMVLMMVAPPLILLGAPLIPMVRGLPRFAAREFAGPLLNWRPAQRVGNTMTHPVVALLLMPVMMFAWHIPGPYELALRSSSWHQVEHACFFFTSLLFWWPVIQPWPSRGLWPRWAMIPYLLVADLQNTILSAALAFSDRALYPSYSTTPRLFGLSALEDQVAAGAIMWVAGSLAFVVPAIVIVVQCLSRGSIRDQQFSNRRADSVSHRFRGDSPRNYSLGRLLPVRSTGTKFEAISFAVMFVAVGLCWAWLASASSDGDDLSLRFSRQTGTLAIAVFTSPGESVSHSTEFAVLVQDRNSLEVMSDAEVRLTAHKDDARPSSAFATTLHQDPQNKLLQSAVLNMPTTGIWLLDIFVRRGLGNAKLSMALNIVSPESSTENRWPYGATISFFAILVLVYRLRHAADPESITQSGCHEEFVDLHPRR